MVVSAMGKTTQQLLTAGAEAARGEKEQALARLRDLRQMHERQAAGTPGRRAVFSTRIFLSLANCSSAWPPSER